MRKLTLILMLIINTNVFAQNEKAFFCKDSADAKKIAALIMENAANDYYLTKSLNRRNDIYIEYMNNAHDVIVIHFKLLPGGGTMLIGIKGKYEELFPFWKKNFEADADMMAVAKTGKGEVVKIPFRDGKLIFYFIRLAGSKWYMRGMYEADTANKQ